MKTIWIGAVAIAGATIASPAAAQFTNDVYQDRNGAFANQAERDGAYRNDLGANGDFSVRIERLRARIQAGVQSGAISSAEAPPLRQQLRALTQLERRYAAGGLTAAERSTLQTRFRTLRQQIRTADGGQGQAQSDDDDGQLQGQYGNSQYGAQPGNGQYDRRYDRDNDGFDDRDYDRDGRWDDDARNGGVNDADDGEYEQPVQRGGLGGIIDSVLGRGATGALRVGQRASGGLYALPSEYRNQYRDTNSVYFRTDGRQIYQIDARNQTVVRVYAMNR